MCLPADQFVDGVSDSLGLLLGKRCFSVIGVLTGVVRRTDATVKNVEVSVRILKKGKWDNCITSLL